MNLHPPYKILHVYLNQQFSLQPIDTDLQGVYLLFWWQNIILGDFFIQPNTRLSQYDYHRMLIEATLPVVEYYGREKQIEIKRGEKLNASYTTEDWLSVIEKVFSGFKPGKLPSRVPVSVIVCTRNRAQQLNRCLFQFSHLVSLPEEIIVVDNAPTDNSSLEVVQQFAHVRYVKEPKPGLDIARNTGIQQAKFTVIAFVDDDVIVHPLWLYRVWEAFQEPKTAAMTGLVVAAALETEAQCIFEKYWSFNRGYIDKTYDQAFFENTLTKGPPVWKIGAGANMAFRKHIFEEVGYFDKLLDVGAAGCNGDSELWYRILAKGYTIHYNPKAIVFHEHRREMNELKRQIFYYMRGHTVAALIQQQQHQQAGYSRYLFRSLPRQYSRMIKTGFPAYRYRHSTLWSEIWGLLSGVLFYVRNRYLRSNS